MNHKSFLPFIARMALTSFALLSSVAAAADLDTVDGRLRWAIQENIENPWPGITDPNNAPGVYSYALACLYLDTNVNQANDLIVDFYTNNPVPDSDGIDYNGYFWQHIMWRLYHDPAMNARLTPQARTIIEDNMWLWLRTRSHILEAQGTEWVYHGSENHDAMQKGSHLLCALALKNAPGYGPSQVLKDGSTVGEHATAWTDYFQRYFIGRAKEGINAEIASPIYAKYSVGAYYNIMDFSDSPVLRGLAEKFITLYWADTASDWVSTGVRGGGEARCYKENYLRRGTNYSFHELLWAYGWHQRSGATRTYPLIAATSSYRIPDIITACAADPNRPGFLYTSRRWGRTSGSSGNNNYVTFDNGDSSLLRETWVTKDFSMGTLTFDMKKDYLQILDQNRAMGVMFSSGINDRVMIFGKGAANNKSYADLNGVCRENCMVVQRDKNSNSSGNATLVFVAQNLWDNRVETGGWLFLNTGDAFCAIKPAGGGYTAASAESGYDLELGDLWAPVVLQVGQAVDYPDFAAFQSSVMANALTYSSDTLNYTSEAGDTFTVYANSKTTPQVNGSTVDLNPTKTYDSPYLSMVHGEDIATVSYGGYPNLVLDFGGPPLLVSRAPADNSTEVPVNTNLVATFDEPVQAGTGFVTLKRSSDDSTVESFDVTNPSEVVFSDSRFTIDPGSNLEPDVEYYVLIDAHAVEDLSGNPFAGLDLKTTWDFAISASAVTVVNTDFGVVPDTGEIPPEDLENNPYTVSFDAGATADKLIVALSSELGGAGPAVITYNGTALVLAPGTTGGRNRGIWYLDNPFTGGPADLVIDMTNYTTVNGIGFGIVSIAGSAPGVSGGIEAAGLEVSLSAPVDGSFIISAYGSNGGNIPTVPVGHTQVYTSGNIGSADGAAAYLNDVAAGSQTVTYAQTDPISNRTCSAVFLPFIADETFADWIGGFPGVGGDDGLDDDPDGDGLPNGIENFFGTAPDAFSKGLVFDAPHGAALTFTHPQNSTPGNDLSTTYLWSTDLITFHLGGVSDAEGTRVDFSPQANTPASDITTVTASMTGTPTKQLFVIVEVTQN